MISEKKMSLIGGDELAFRQTEGQKLTYSAKYGAEHSGADRSGPLVESLQVVGKDSVEVIAVDECLVRPTLWSLPCGLLRTSCPSMPFANESDYFPLEVGGNTWIYSYSNFYYNMFAGHAIIRKPLGTMQWTVISATECVGGGSVRMLCWEKVKASFSGQYRWRSVGYP